MSRTMLLILAIQVTSFVALGALFLYRGDWRLGVSQLMLAVIQTVIYSRPSP